MPWTAVTLAACALLGLALVASPVVGTASAYVCGWDDVECRERQARECVVEKLLEPFPPTTCPP